MRGMRIGLSALIGLLLCVLPLPAGPRALAGESPSKSVIQLAVLKVQLTSHGTDYYSVSAAEWRSDEA